MLLDSKLDYSLYLAQEVLDTSDNLSDTNVSARHLYCDRHDFLKHLVGEEGVTSFYPIVATDVTAPYKDHLSKVYDKVCLEYIHDTYEGTSADARQRLYLLERLMKASNEDIINNKVPAIFSNFVKDNDIKGHSSPKLSKALVKLCGQDSDVVKWFTNQCPKSLTKGENKAYKIHFSILPNHIAGMSYYAPYNTGGKPWREGWNRTSCMDTRRNGDGETIFQLPPNLKDSTLAIAWLSYADDDVEEPKMLARMLVRLCELSKGQYLLIGQRIYFTDNEVKYVLIEGMKNEFEMFHHVLDIRNYDRSKEKRYVTYLKDDLEWTTDQVRQSCECCGGDGYDYDGDTCYECDGDGYYYDEDSFMPYNDDEDIITLHGDKIRYTFPTDFLIKNDLLLAENE